MPNEELEYLARSEGIGRNTFINAKKELGVELRRAPRDATWRAAMAVLSPSPDNEPAQPLS